jgi:hypothetical protein
MGCIPLANKKDYSAHPWHRQRGELSRRYHFLLK